MVFFFFAVNDWRQKRGAVSCQSGGFCALFDVPRVRGRLCRSIAGAVERDWLFPRGGGGREMKLLLMEKEKELRKWEESR